MWQVLFMAHSSVRSFRASLTETKFSRLFGDVIHSLVLNLRSSNERNGRNEFIWDDIKRICFELCAEALSVHASAFVSLSIRLRVKEKQWVFKRKCRKDATAQRRWPFLSSKAATNEHRTHFAHVDVIVSSRDVENGSSIIARCVHMFWSLVQQPKDKLTSSGCGRFMQWQITFCISQP